MTENLRYGWRLAHRATTFLEGDIYVGILDSFEIDKISEDVIDFRFGFDLDDDLFDFFGGFAWFSHEHDANLVHENLWCGKERRYVRDLIKFYI